MQNFSNIKTAPNTHKTLDRSQVLYTCGVLDTVQGLGQLHG